MGKINFVEIFFNNNQTSSTIMNLENAFLESDVSGNISIVSSNGFPFSIARSDILHQENDIDQIKIELNNGVILNFLETID